MSNFGKKGVLLVNLGTPDAPTVSAVRKYLKQFLLDPRVIDYPWIARQILIRGIILPFRSRSSAKLYKRLWEEKGSPLKFHGYKVAEDEYHVELAMRYQTPSIDGAIDKMMKAGVSEIVVFPMFPQYASASTGSAHEEVMRVISTYKNIPPMKIINSFYDNPQMLDVIVENSKPFNFDDYDHIIFSYHGIPKRHLRNSDISCKYCQKVDNCCGKLSKVNQFCYSAQSYATTRALVERLKLPADRYTTSFQSRLGREEWTTPYTIDVIEGLAEKGAKTTVEIKFEYQEDFEKAGGEHIDLVPSLNDNPKWIEAIRDMVLEA
jgi:ferrochelatase